MTKKEVKGKNSGNLRKAGSYDDKVSKLIRGYSSSRQKNMKKISNNISEKNFEKLVGVLKEYNDTNRGDISNKILYISRDFPKLIPKLIKTLERYSDGIGNLIVSGLVQMKDYYGVEELDQVTKDMGKEDVVNTIKKFSGERTSRHIAGNILQISKRHPEYLSQITGLIRKNSEREAKKVGIFLSHVESTNSEKLPKAINAIKNKNIREAICKYSEKTLSNPKIVSKITNELEKYPNKNESNEISWEIDRKIRKWKYSIKN